jgi:ubiquitin C-terminal hydrolase
VHSGSADSGHYYTILFKDKAWRVYDDSRVSLFYYPLFESYCYGGTFATEEWGSGSSTNAYVLVYEKLVKSPIKILEQN